MGMADTKPLNEPLPDANGAVRVQPQPAQNVLSTSHGAAKLDIQPPMISHASQQDGQLNGTLPAVAPAGVSTGPAQAAFNGTERVEMK